MKKIYVLMMTTLMACEVFKTQGSTIDTSSTGPSGIDTDSEPDSNPDSQPEVDTGPDTDTEDTSDPNAIDCAAVPQEGQFPNMTDFECGTSFIQDGVPVLGTTVGGVSYFDSTHYEESEWYCVTSARGDYDSLERVYMFTHPGEGHTCSVYLESPCADLDLFAVRYNPYTSTPPECPAPEQLSIQCEYSSNQGPGFDEEIPSLFENNQTMWMLIVDAPTPTDAWFRLTVECD